MKNTPKILSLLGMTALLVHCSANGVAAEQPVAAKQQAASPAKEDNRVFATIGKEKISAKTFFETFQAAVKKKYYHGKVPAQEMAKFQREVGKRMIEEHLLLAEAKRLGMKPDQKKIDETIANVDAKFGQNPQFKEKREMMIQPIIQEMRNKDLLAQMEAKARIIPDQKEANIRTYYELNLDKFTEPQENKISTILLKVDPSSGKPGWDAARTKAEELVKRIRSGEDFASLSKEHSGDKSASKGGKMGYLHKGMLAPVAEEAIDKLSVGEITDPIMVLEGIAIFRLDDRIEAELLTYEKARKRASELLKRELGEDAWNALKAKLWAKGSVKINEELYLPLQEESPSSPAGSPQGGAGAASGKEPAPASGK